MATMTIGELDLESAAKEAVGNWQEFDCFSLGSLQRDRRCGPDSAIVYTKHRDSGLLDESNAEAIAEAMQPFLDQEPCDVYEEHHNHFAVGWVDGYAIRVFRRGRDHRSVSDLARPPTRLADYPLLDEEDYSARNTKRPSKTSQMPLGGSGGTTTCPMTGHPRSFAGYGTTSVQRSKTEMTAAATHRKRHCSRAFDGL